VKFQRSILVAVTAICAATAASASTIQLGISGDAQVGSSYISFGQYPDGTPYTPAPGYGTFEVSPANSGVLVSAGVTAGEFGKIQSLNASTGSVTLPSAFITFDSGAFDLQLWANNIPAGDVGPFTLTDTADGAVLSFDVDGYIWDTESHMKIDTFTGTFSATFDGEAVAQLLHSLPLDSPFSATFMATAIPTCAPEPASMLLMGAGLLGIAFVGRRKRRS